MKQVRGLFKPVLFSIIILLFGTGFLVADEIDDASLFVEAFTAYQKKDYLLAMEKVAVLQQLFPDSPLQDVTLLLLARASFKSGDNELAARTLMRFNREYTTNPLKASIEQELNALVIRKERGELLAPDQQLSAVAQKIRTARLARQQPGTENVEQFRLVRDASTSRVEDVTVSSAHNEKPARESVRAAISVISNDQVVEAGKNGLVQFEVANQGTSGEDFKIQVIAPVEYGAGLMRDSRTVEKDMRVTIEPDAPYKGTVSFKMPNDKVDGYRGVITLRTASTRFSDVVQSRDVYFSAAGPLVRVVARPSHLQLQPGAQTSFRITLINAGSLPARTLTVRVNLPPQTDFLGANGGVFRQEAPGIITFDVSSLETGRLVELGIDVKLRKEARTGQELRSRIEVTNAQQKTRETYTSAAVLVE
jgi:hypothetical protein